MNVHDSERLAGLLEEAGYARAHREPADVVVFNTCAVRENADNRLYGNLGQLLPAKKQHPGMQIAVGGCLAQKDRGEIVRQGALGRRRVRHPQHRRSCRCCWNGPGSSSRLRSRSPSRWSASRPRLPTRRDSAYSAWVSVSVGCNNTCTFCIVPSLAGSGDRPATGGDPRGDRDAGRGGGAGDHPARAERERVRRGVRRPAGVRLAAAGVRRDRRAGTGALHLAPSPGLHRRRDRGHGRDAQRDAAAAHAPAIGIGCRPASDASLLPQRPLPADHRRRARSDAARRRSPPTSSWVSRARPRPISPTRWPWSSSLPVRCGLHLPVLDPGRNPGRDDGGPDPEGRGAGAVRTAGRAGRRDRLAGEPDPGRSTGRGACSPTARAAKTPPPHGCRAGPGTTDSCTSRCPRTRGSGHVPAISARSGSATPPRTT